MPAQGSLPTYIIADMSEDATTAFEFLPAAKSCLELDETEVVLLLEATPLNAPRLHPTAQETEVDRNPSQFSLGTIFAWMTTIALMIGVWRFASWLEDSGYGRPLFTFLMGGFGALVLLASFVSAIQRTRLSLYSKTTIGVIAGYRERGSAKDRLRSFAIVHFRTALGIYEVETNWDKQAFEDSRPVGRRVKVTYDPSYPTVAAADKSQFGSVVEVIFLGLFGAIFLIPAIFELLRFLR